MICVFLPAPQQVSHRVGVQQAGDAEVVGLLVAARGGRGAERRAVEDDLVEFGVGAERFEAVVLVGLGLLARRVLERFVVEALRFAVRLAEHVVALGLHLAGQVEQRRHRRQEDARRLAGLPRPDVAADRLREEQRRRRAGGVDADRQPRHVDALGNHPHRDQPPAGARREVRDACRRAGVVGQHDGRRLAGQPGQHGGIGARGLLVGRDDHGARVGHAAVAQLRQPGVGGLQHRRYPLALRVEDRAPGPRRLLGVQRLAQPGRVSPRPRWSRHRASPE